LVNSGHILPQFSEQSRLKRLQHYQNRNAEHRLGGQTGAPNSHFLAKAKLFLAKRAASLGGVKIPATLAV
jgi:hypothetical protein